MSSQAGYCANQRDRLLRVENPEAKLRAMESYLKSIISLKMSCKKPNNVKIHDALIKQINDRIKELTKQIQNEKQNHYVVSESS